jgi:hypothetical protein
MVLGSSWTKWISPGVFVGGVPRLTKSWSSLATAGDPVQPGGPDAEGTEDLRALWVFLAYDGGLHDGWVLDEHAFDLERSDAVRARGNHVVVTTLEPEVAIPVLAALPPVK